MTQPNHGGPVIVGGRLDLPYDADFVMEIVIPEDTPAFLMTDQVEWRFADGADAYITDEDDNPYVFAATLIEDEDNPGTSRLVQFDIDVLDVRPVALIEPDQARLHFIRDPDVDLLWDVWSTRRV